MKPASLADDTRAALRRIPVAPGPVDLTRFPDFLILGPQRTGSTWLYRNLQHHPRVLLPTRKETYFFSTLGNPQHPRFRFPTLQDYLALFRTSPKQSLKRHYDAIRHSLTLFRPAALGEATATYATLHPDTIREITLLNPDLKAVLMLRDPVDRAWSHAKKDFRKSGQKLSSAPLTDLASHFAGKGQKRLADFPAMVRNWAQFLKPGHLFLASFEEFEASAARLLAAVCDFLLIPSDPRFFYGKHLGAIINPTAQSPIPDPVRNLLESTFTSERAAFQSLLEEINSSRSARSASAAGFQISVIPSTP